MRSNLRTGGKGFEETDLD